MLLFFLKLQKLHCIEITIPKFIAEMHRTNPSLKDKSSLIREQM